MKRSPNSEDGADEKRPRKYSKINLKMSVTLVLVVLALFLLIYKVYSIQNENAEEYNKIVLSQRQNSYVSQTIPARRGDIYDRNGNRLATSEKVYYLILDPKQMTDAELKKQDGTKTYNVVEPTLKAVAEYFQLDYSELNRLVTENPNSRYIRAAKNISYEQMSEFTEYMETQNELLAKEDVSVKTILKGLWFEDNYVRTYPYGDLACSVIGFASADGTSGTGGVEQYYNEQLTGTTGREYGYLNDDADLESVVKSAQNGETLVLTIDTEIQGVVEKYLAEWADGEIGSKSAACIVMNPNNGEILAMASTNSFDLNDPITTGRFTDDEVYAFGLEQAVSDYRSKYPDSPAITVEEVPSHYTYEEIMDLGEINASYRIWRNICVSDTYEPGSTQKIFTVAGAMEEGIIDKNDTYLCEGHVELSDGVNSWKINCVNRNGHGLLDVTGGITNSCNVVMMNIAFEESAETFMKYERIFGFGDYTGIDLPAEANTQGLGFASDTIGRTQLATNSFGQNYNCTMIQMAAAYASVINGGNYYQPHVVKQILTSEGTLVKENDKLLVRQTVSESTCDYLIDALYQTVNGGTGKAAKVEGYTVGGKTGTAQKLPRSAETYVVSFCGFAPVDDPQLLCYVIVDEPNLPGQEAAHSSFASEIFSKIMAEALPIAGIYPEGMDASNYSVSKKKTEEAHEPETGTGQNDGGNTEQETERATEEERQTESENASEPHTEQETLPQVSPAAGDTDEYIHGDDGGGQIPEIIFGVAPGEMQ